MKNTRNVKSLIQGLLAGLSPRQRKVLEGRFGLRGEYLTLAEIGKSYGLTRERVRQVEKAALVSIRSKFAEGELVSFIQEVAGLLKKFSGVRGESMLLQDLGLSDKDTPSLNFILEASDKFHYCLPDKEFNGYWYLNRESNEKARNSVSGLVTYLRNNRGLPYEPQNALEANYVSISKLFTYSPFSEFGLTDWPEVCPCNARDWAYLILKKERKPLHFTKLAELVDRLRKDNKKTNPQTIHNELIKDDRFVLVGRGTYGLKELGLLPGTAKEVITHFLQKHGPLAAKEVMELVLQQRMFKENTLLINLQNRKYFQRMEDGRYSVREA